MLNNTGVKRESYSNVNQILFNVEHQVSVGIIVSEDVGVVDAKTGRKIAKAGTPLRSNSVGGLTDRSGSFVLADNTKGADGILLHDVDVTNGENNGTLLIFGFVDVYKIDSALGDKLTPEIMSSMPLIKFLG